VHAYVRTAIKNTKTGKERYVFAACACMHVFACMHAFLLASCLTYTQARMCMRTNDVVRTYKKMHIHFNTVLDFDFRMLNMKQPFRF